MTDSPNSAATFGYQTVAGAISSQSQFVFPQNQLISTRLDESNYLIWKQQVLTAIRGYGLEHFINGEGVVPDGFITDPETQQQSVNPAFVLWQRQDQLLASWILSSLTESILILMVGLHSSRDVWHTLETNFASQSRAKLMQYKLQLQTLKKGGMTMREFLNKMKSCCDVLASAGQRVTEEDQILHILAGLGSEYDPVMVNITSRIEPCTVVDVQALLLSYESRLEVNHFAVVNTEGSQPSANIVTPTNTKKFFPGNSQGSRAPQYNFQGNMGRRTYGRGNFRGRGGRFQSNRPYCQLCQGPGHTADRCWHRFDANFPGPNSGQNQFTYNNRNPSLNLAQLPANITHPAATEFGNESCWFPDSGASTHVTNDLSNLNIASEYNGSNKLQMGNGAGSSYSGYTPQRDT